MKSLNIKAYRFSIAWPRVIPAGTGKVNEKGLAFYDKLIDAMLAAGIEPYLTLFHWDYPYELYARGGWLNRECADWFADYAKLIVDRYSDRVSNWMTLNEPNVFLGQGHMNARHAPGMKLGMDEMVRATWNTLIAHGKGVQVIRSRAKKPPQVGFAPGIALPAPVSDSPADIAAAREYGFDGSVEMYGNCAWWLDPVFLGKFPEAGMEIARKSHIIDMRDGDMDIIHQDLDFCGANIYYGRRIFAGPDGKPQKEPLPVERDTTARRWPIMPEALYWGPRFLYERYGKPIIITENGMSCADIISQDEHAVHDPQRVEFMRRYLKQLSKACDDGVKVAAYFAWTFMDNFEWSFGYQERFGMVYVNYATQERIPKDSAYWYRDIIASNGAKL